MVALVEWAECFSASGITQEDAKPMLDWLEKQKETLKLANSIPADCVSDAKCEDRWQKVQDSLPGNSREVICKDSIGNYFIGRYYRDNVWTISAYDDEDKTNEYNPEVVEWCEIPSEKQKEQKSLSTEETELNSIAFLEQLGYTCIPPQKQAPVAFTKEDEVMWQNLIECLEGHFGLLPGGKEKFVAWLKERFVKFAYPKPGWKPSEEQMNALLNLKFFKDKLGPSAIGAAIDSLYEDLEKLIHE